MSRMPAIALVEDALDPTLSSAAEDRSALMAKLSALASCDMIFLAGQPCNAILRKRPQAAPGQPIEQVGDALPSWYWFGGMVSIDSEKLLFQGYRRIEGKFADERDYRVPLDRIVGLRVKRGPFIVRFLEVKISNGGRLHLRPTKFKDSMAKMEEALAAR